MTSPALSQPGQPWHATPAWWRALAVAVSGFVLAVVLRRPDLVVLTSPFALAVAMDIRSPRTRPPSVSTEVEPTMLREGESVRVTHHHRHDIDGLLTLSVDPLDPLDPLDHANHANHANHINHADRSVEDQDDAHPPRATVFTGTCRTTMTPPWGSHLASPRASHCLTPWGGWSMQLPSPDPTRYLVLPVRAGFPRIPEPRPFGREPGPDAGLREGEGLDFQGLRSYQPGEAPRRVNWPATLRTGRMVVTQTYADTVPAYLLILDAHADPRLGDLVRQVGQFAAAAIRRGGAVALAVHGSGDLAPIPLGSGERHLTRLEMTLARVSPREAPTNDYQHGRTRRLALLPGTIVLVLSPLVDPRLTALLTHLQRQHMRVSVLDTSDPAAGPIDAGVQVVRRRTLQVAGIRVSRYDGAAALALASSHPRWSLR